jgi:glucose-6-phosphate 1-dehydrogenase
MIKRLVIFGATGDLTARYVLPGIAALHDAGLLPPGFTLTCASREDWADGRYRDWASAQLDRHADDLKAGARQAVVAACRYRRADVTDAAQVAAAVAGEGPAAAYLALPPAVFPATVRALRDAPLPAGSRIVLEKPFGENLDDAVALNELLSGFMAEEAVFRVDHFLAMTTVQNILGARLANRVLEPI